MPEYFVLAYYYFTSIEDPKQEVALHKEFFKNRDISSRIYISEQGINGQMSGKREDAEAYMRWMHSRPPYDQIYFKIHTHHENVFPRKTVKYRPLVALDEEVDLAYGGEHLSPAEWKTRMEAGEVPLILDVRNEYEWKVGRFEGAECPPCQTFREFKQYTVDLKEKIDPKTTPVMMYCTGGIRCELYSAVLRKGGFEKVYQLDGGVINYGQKQGNDHWLGKLYVFDDRMTVPICDEPAPVIGECEFCVTPTESYYNCANMECNHLYLCCAECLHQHAGCCCTECMSAPKVRPYHQQDAHKPFRKWYHYFEPLTKPK